MWTGCSIPFSCAWPRSVNRTPSRRRARWTISRLASTSPARAREQSRPATFRAAAAEPSLDGYGLAGIEPDAHRERKGRIGDRLLDEPLLQGHGTADRRARRAEDDQGFVTPELDHPSAVILDQCPNDAGEACREKRSPLVPPFLREGRVAADIGDQEGMDVSVSIRVRVGLTSICRLAHQG